MLQEIALKMHEFRELQSQTDLVGSQNTYLCKLNFIKQLNEGVKSQVPYKGHTLGHAQPSGEDVLSFSELVPNPFAERSCDKICSNQCVFYMSIHVCVEFI